MHILMSAQAPVEQEICSWYAVRGACNEARESATEESQHEGAHTVSFGLLRGALGWYGSNFLLVPVPVPTA